MKSREPIPLRKIVILKRFFSREIPIRKSIPLNYLVSDCFSKHSKTNHKKNLFREYSDQAAWYAEQIEPHEPQIRHWLKSRIRVACLRIYRQSLPFS